MTKNFIGIDAGASATKWAIYDESGTCINSGISDPLDGHVFRSESRERVTKFVKELKGKISGDPAGIYAGITGASQHQEKNSEIHSLFLQEFPTAQISIEIDVALGYRANFMKSRGVYLYAGTGSIAVFADESDEIRTVGGWGYLLGDEGAGYWIGREAMTRVLDELEREIRESDIREIFTGILSEINLDEIIKFTYGNSRREIAGLAHVVFKLAKDGDQKALELIKDAAKHLAELVLRTEKVSKLQSPKVVFGGGIAQSGEILISEIERILQRTIEISDENLSHDAAHLAIAKYRSSF